jgi:hypothetical protein
LLWGDALEISGNVTEPLPTILLVDADLGFVFWLGRALDSAGFRALPAKSTQDARTLLHELRVTVDLLVIDPTLSEASSLITFLQQSSQSVKVVATGSWELEPGFPRPDAIGCRPPHLDNQAVQEWLQLIQSTLRCHAAGF